ncbi:Heavy metal-associated domain containing protein [Quillaja saponaria]|uniref:Heavy metal-associated domain containing protein n=1 Tax=Quillaja saponaria TaxID=32244 RepID=A0AAD7KVP8_QUISA|nr:Heavy metal-associated domain containing protein [Quillaja saponaria]
MNMKKNNKKMIRGFMCHSQAATAVCMNTDPWSVVVPRRPDRTICVDNMRLINNDKYSRLGDQSHRISSANKKSVPVPSIKQRDQQDQENEHKTLQKTPPADHVFQVVVMRVSLHCQGCAGKVKKHLSKMEGVTSYSVDLENERVTVKGNIAPAIVLESISKVKRAEFWPC